MNSDEHVAEIAVWRRAGYVVLNVLDNHGATGMKFAG